jgi:hypothetical protein
VYCVVALPCDGAGAGSWWSTSVVNYSAKNKNKINVQVGTVPVPTCIDTIVVSRCVS